MSKFLSKIIAAFLMLSIFSLHNASAVSLDAAASVNSISVNFANSYDPPSYNAFAPFNSATANDIFSFSSFTGGFPGGANLSFHMLSEVAYFDGNHVPGLGNKFGLLNSANQFQTIFDTAANPGDSHALTQGQNESFTFALLSPEGLFSSIDGNNPDGGAAHLIAKKVEKNTQVFIQQTTLFGGTLTFDLIAGDYILFWEDLLNKGNTFNHAGLPSDFDYNDLIIVVRQTEVPEPSTYLMLGLATLAMICFRRKNAQKA